MGCATKGGGAVGSGPKNKMVSETSQKTGPAMVAKGGLMSKKMMGGGMAYKKDGGLMSKKR
jgi:hypothetical protein